MSRGYGRDERASSHSRAMDPVRFGADVRLLRLRRGWTQQRLASEAMVSRWVVAEVEAGRAPRIRVEHLARVVSALAGYLSVRILYQGEGLDRLRDRRHAAMVVQLRAEGWDVATEVSFSIFGERGSIDILAFHPLTRTLLVIEVKTVVPDVGGMLATLDRKVRLSGDLARDRGWEVASVGRLLVLPESSTARRRINEHAATFQNAFPERNVEVSRWLQSPSGAMSGLLFLSSAREDGTRRPNRRARTAGAGHSRTSSR